MLLPFLACPCWCRRLLLLLLLAGTDRCFPLVGLPLLLLLLHLPLLLPLLLSSHHWSCLLPLLAGSCWVHLLWLLGCPAPGLLLLLLPLLLSTPVQGCLLPLLAGSCWVCLGRLQLLGLSTGGPLLLLLLLLPLLLCHLRVVLHPQLVQQRLAKNKGPGLGQVEGLAAGRAKHLQAGQQGWKLKQRLQKHLNVVSKLAACDAPRPHKYAKPFRLQMLHQSLTNKEV